MTARTTGGGREGFTLRQRTPLSDRAQAQQLPPSCTVVRAPYGNAHRSGLVRHDHPRFDYARADHHHS